METYSNYIPTDVFWQPYMPSHWRVVKLRHVLTKLQRERTSGAELLICSNKGTVSKRGDSKLGLVAEDEQVYQGVANGDLLIHGMDTWHGAIALSGYDGMCTPVVHVCDSSQNKAFISYYLRNMAVGKVFKLISNGVRQNTSDFRSWEKLASIPAVLPSLSEQQAIVAYLDDKCAKLDRLVANKEKEITLLQEMKQRVIADAVTIGINSDVEMIETGIFWWSSAPKAWKVMRLGHILTKQNRLRPTNAELLVCTNKGKTVKRGDSKMGLVADSDAIYQGVAKGDLLIHGMDTWHGAIAVSEFDGMCTPVVHVCTSSQNCEYVALYMQVMAYSKIFKLISNGVRQNTSDFRSWNKVATIPIPLPPLNEQDLIVDFIKKKTSAIDTLCDKLQQEIDNIKEYKQRLTSDVVTGQIKVS